MKYKNSTPSLQGKGQIGLILTIVIKCVKVELNKDYYILFIKKISTPFCFRMNIRQEQALERSEKIF